MGTDHFVYVTDMKNMFEWPEGCEVGHDVHGWVAVYEGETYQHSSIYELQEALWDTFDALYGDLPESEEPVPFMPVPASEAPTQVIEAPEAHTQMGDMVNAPAHYNHGPIEVIDIIEGFQLGYHLGNVVKYVLRADKKGERLQDLKKARWYLSRVIENEEKGR